MTTANRTPAASTPPSERITGIALWTLQVFLALFLVVAAAGPKLLGQQTAVTMFAEIGAGQWLRYLVGVLELAGAVGLVVPALAGLAALGLTALMVGAVTTQLAVPDVVGPAVTPAVMAVLFVLVAWMRRPRGRTSFTRH